MSPYHDVVRVARETFPVPFEWYERMREGFECHEDAKFLPCFPVAVREKGMLFADV